MIVAALKSLPLTLIALAPEIADLVGTLLYG
jgi:hypothetical protein